MVDERIDQDERSSIEDLDENIRILRGDFSRYVDSRKKGRLENVHIVVALAIIGAYFTQSAQDLITTSGIQIPAQVLTGLSGVYILIKIATTTAVVNTDNRYVEIVDSTLAPTLLLLSTYGSVITALLLILNINIGQILRVQVVSVGISILSAILAVITLRSNYQNLQEERSQTQLEKLRADPRALVNYIYSNPRIIEEDFQWKSDSSEQPDDRFRFDLIGEDSKGQEVAVEVKTNLDRQTLHEMVDIYNGGDIDRLVVAALNISSGATKELRSSDIEFRDVASQISREKQTYMNRTPVSSSNLKSVGYDPQQSLLEIEFHSGGIYQYHNVPERIYQGLMSAASHGSYHHQHIRDQYRYTQIR